MADETPPTEEQTPLPEEPAEGTPPVPSEGEQPSSPAAAPPTVDWRDRRIAQLTARRHQLEQELEQYRQQIPPAAPPPSPQVGDAEFQRLVNEAAEQRARTELFNRQCNEVAQAGRLAFTDFDARISALRGMVDPSDSNQSQQYNRFLEAAIETGEGAKVLHTLGGDVNEAMRILSLSPTRMAVELTKLAVGGSREVSSAPRPIRPVGTRSPVTEIEPDDPDAADKLSTETWMRRREAQLSARREGRR